ncbi:MULTISPECIES: hypothetical protein [Aquitalea]|uniref:hypothetical protein n=1 Tax=Aquitalea TaxID=407217 RepID=UPI001315444E|nr:MULTISPECIES: hypothetical protein [Aquitalea]
MFQKDLRDNANITYKTATRVAANMFANDILQNREQVITKEQAVCTAPDKS